MNLNMRLYKKMPTGVYYVEFERGRARSLKTKDKEEAKKLFLEVRRQYLAGRLAEIRGESTVTLGEFVEEYRKWAREAREPKTYAADMLALAQVLTIAGASTRLDKLTLKHADMMVASCKKRGNRPGTINAYIRHLRSASKKMVEWGYLPSAPFRAVREVPREQKSPSYILGKDVTGFLAGIGDHDERRILAAYVYSGRRRGELLRLRWKDVALERDEYYVARSKAHLSRWYPMHPIFRAVLEAIGLGDPEARIFSRWSHPDSITHLAKKALLGAGYPEMTLHKLRHTFATLLIDQGVDLVTIGALLGHTDKRATEIYTHVSDTRQRAAIRMVASGPVDLSGA